MPLAPFVEIPEPQRAPNGAVIFGPNGQPLPQRDAHGNIVYGIAINPIKQATKGYWLVSNPVTIALAAAAGPGLAGAIGELDFLIDSQGHFDWAYIVGQSTGAYNIEFFDPGTQHNLQNRPVHNQNVVGSAVRPFRLPEPYFFDVGDAQRVLRARLRNLTESTNTVRLVLYGRRFYHREAAPEVALKMRRAFRGNWRTYSYFLSPREMLIDGTVAVVGANGTTTFTFEADDTADSELSKLMSVSTGAFTFRIRERDTNRFLSNDVIVDTNGWGNGEFPFIFADSLLLERQKALLVDVTDTSGSENRIFLTIAGRRLHYR